VDELEPYALVPVTRYVVMVVGLSLQFGPVVPAQPPPVQVKVLADGLQLAVIVEEPPRLMVAGEALRLQTGALATTPGPLTVTKCGLPGALLVTLTPPSRVPTAVGVNVTPIEHEPPATTLLPQLCVAAKTLMVGSMLEIISAAPPVLDKVTYCAELVVPVFCSSKVTVIGDSNAVGDSTPLPVMLMANGLFAALEVITTLPFLVPNSVGEKFTLILQLAPIAKELVQL